MVKYKSGDEVIEVRILDDAGGKLDARRCNKSDSAAGGRLLKWLVEKWGWNPKVEGDIIDLDSEFLKY